METVYPPKTICKSTQILFIVVKSKQIEDILNEAPELIPKGVRLRNLFKNCLPKEIKNRQRVGVYDLIEIPAVLKKNQNLNPLPKIGKSLDTLA
jgi:hypothetical protein